MCPFAEENILGKGREITLDNMRVRLLEDSIDGLVLRPF